MTEGLFTAENLAKSIWLTEYHYGPLAGRVYLNCGLCQVNARVDRRDSGSLMALAQHITSHKRAGGAR